LSPKKLLAAMLKAPLLPPFRSAPRPRRRTARRRWLACALLFSACLLVHDGTSTWQHRLVARQGAPAATGASQPTSTADQHPGGNSSSTSSPDTRGADGGEGVGNRGGDSSGRGGGNSPSSIPAGPSGIGGSNSSGSVGSSGPAAPKGPAPPRATPLLFFDVGAAYHHLPACPQSWARPGVGCDAEPCPVAWEWTKHRPAADVGEQAAAALSSLDAVGRIGLHL
jgi:hypothetical protein